MFTEKPQAPVITGIPTRIYVPPLKVKFDPTELFFKTKKKNYSVMRTFVNQVLIDAETISSLPPIELLSIFAPSGVTDKTIMDQFEIKEGKFMTPIEICQVINFITTDESTRSWEKKYPIDSDGTMTLVGYVVCHDKRLRAVTVYRDTLFDQWIINCHELAEWAQKVRLLVKQTNLLKTRGREN